LVRKQNGQKEIHLRLKAVYGDEAMKQWSNEANASLLWALEFSEGMKTWRCEDVSDSSRPGWSQKLELTRFWPTGLSVIHATVWS
jgi:hypothetical protein